MGSKFVKSLIQSQNKHPEGFPPGIWVLLKGHTVVTYAEEDKFGKTMFKNTVRKSKLETEILRDGTGYKVLGLKNSFVLNMSQ